MNFITKTVCLTLFLLAFSFAHASTSVNQWMMHYYQQPTPQQTPQMLQQLVQKKLLTQAKSKAPIIAFFTQVFRQNPTQIETWAKSTQHFAVKQKAVIWQAIWQSNTPQGKEYLRSIDLSANSAEKIQLHKIMAEKPVSLLSKSIGSTAQLDQLWASFFATGDPAYVQKVISVVAWDNPLESKKKTSSVAEVKKAIIYAAAKWSLRSNAKKHDSVYLICQASLKTLRPQDRKEMQEILAGAQLQHGAA